MAQGYNQIATLAVQFLAIPFFLNFWGKERYAEWLVLSSIPIMLSLLDFGVAHATASKAIMLAARNDITGVRRSLQTGFIFSLIVGCLIFMLVWLAGQWANWPELLRLPTLSRAHAQTILLLLSGNLCISLLHGTLGAWFSAMGRSATGSFLLANRRMLDILVTIAALAMGANALQLATVLLLGQLFYFLLITTYANKNTPWPVIGLKHASTIELFSILKPSFAHAGMLAGQVLTLQAGLQFLNQFAPASVVILYSMGRTLMRLVLQVGVVTEHAARPELSRLKGQGDDNTARKLQKRVFLLALAIAGIGYILLIVLGPLIMRTWSSGSVTATRHELAILGIHAIFHVCWMVPSSTRLATNRHMNISIIYMTGCIFGILFLFVHTGNAFAQAAISLSIPELTALIGFMFTSIKQRSLRHQ